MRSIQIQAYHNGVSFGFPSILYPTPFLKCSFIMPALRGNTHDEYIYMYKCRQKSIFSIFFFILPQSENHIKFRDINITQKLINGIVKSD